MLSGGQPCIGPKAKALTIHFTSSVTLPLWYRLVEDYLSQCWFAPGGCDAHWDLEPRACMYAAPAVGHAALNLCTVTPHHVHDGMCLGRGAARQGIPMQPEHVARFRSHVLEGRWGAALALLPQLAPDPELETQARAGHSREAEKLYSTAP